MTTKTEIGFNHNIYNLKVGDVVLLDQDYSDPIKVEIVSMTDLKMYSKIKYQGHSWTVMTNRLTPTT
jgi:flagellar motor switch protein FliM